MNIDEITKKLQKDRIWASGELDTPELEPCPFCGAAGSAKVIVHHPVYGASGAWVRCGSCGARGPCASTYAAIIKGSVFSTPLLPESLDRGITAAVDSWNGGVVDRSRLGNLWLKGAAV